MLPLCMPRGLSTTLNLPGWYNIITAWGFLKKSAFWVVQLYRKVVLCDWKLHNTIRTKKWWPYNRVFNIIDRSNMGGEKMHRESVKMYLVCVQRLTWSSCRRISEKPKTSNNIQVFEQQHWPPAYNKYTYCTAYPTLWPSRWNAECIKLLWGLRNLKKHTAIRPVVTCITVCSCVISLFWHQHKVHIRCYMCVYVCV